jgi:chromosome segregation ATPase
MRVAFLLICALVFFTACATIPEEAPELSMELGRRIDALEEANLLLLTQFFDMKRAQVDLFLQERWIPTLAEELLRNSRMGEGWDAIAFEEDPEERVRFLVTAGNRLQEEIIRRQAELYAPLNDMEERIRGRLREEYTQARAINSSLTNYLYSASQIQENRERYLETAEETENKIGGAIREIDSVVSELNSTRRQGENAASLADSYLSRLRDLQDSF